MGKLDHHGMGMTMEELEAEQKLMLCLTRVTADGIRTMRELQKPVHAALREEFGTAFWDWACKVPLTKYKTASILRSIGVETSEAANIWYSRVFLRVRIRGVRMAAGCRIRTERRMKRVGSWRFDRILQVAAKDGAHAAVLMLMRSAVCFCYDLERENRRRITPMVAMALEDASFIMHSTPADLPDVHYEKRQEGEALIRCLGQGGLTSMTALVGDVQVSSRREVAARMAMDCEAFVCELLDDMALIFGLSPRECRQMAADVICKAKEFVSDPDDMEEMASLVASLYRQTSKAKRDNLRARHHDEVAG